VRRPPTPLLPPRFIRCLSRPLDLVADELGPATLAVLFQPVGVSQARRIVIRAGENLADEVVVFGGENPTLLLRLGYAGLLLRHPVAPRRSRLNPRLRPNCAPAFLGPNDQVQQRGGRG